MLIYQRYIAGSAIGPFLTTAFVVTGIIWITQILRFLYLIDNGLKLTDFLSIIVYIVPSILFTILPFITLFALIYSYHHLNLGKQLIILKNAGLSNKRLTAPAFWFCSLILIFSYLISGYLMPVTYTKLQGKLTAAKNIFSANLINEKEFTSISKDIALYTAKYSAGGLLQGVILFDNNNGEQVIIFAKKGKFTLEAGGNLILELQEGSRQSYDTNHNLTKLYFEDLVILLQEKNGDSTSNYRRRNLKEYFIGELLFPKGDLLQKKKNELIAEGHQRIIWPLYIVILSILALSILLNAPYSKKHSDFFSILVAIGLSIIVTYLHFTFYNMSTSNLNFIYCSYFLAFFTLFLSFTIIATA
jgi:lipopolysaccharide export system permease protein